MAKKKKEPEKPSAKPPDYVFGRPSLYRPEYCEMLVKHMASGLSFDTFAAVIDVNLDTLYEWAKVHPAFSEAKKTAFLKNLHFWEMQGMKGMWEDADGPKINPTIWIFNMKNRHRWRDKHDIEVKTDDTQLAEKEKIKRMSDSELKEYIKQSLKEDK
jgi:hypothetical protein